jgi:hypothetical protein
MGEEGEGDEESGRGMGMVREMGGRRRRRGMEAELRGQEGGSAMVLIREKKRGGIQVNRSAMIETVIQHTMVPLLCLPT